MNLIVSSQQIKELDSKTINDFGIPSRVLMENAGKGCADLLHNAFSGLLKQGVVVLCGFGNNGGDGFVIARWLDYYGYDVSIITVCKGNSSPETIANRDLCKKLLIEFIDVNDEDFEELSEQVLFDAGIIIDAVYGINFKGKLNEQVSNLFKLANETKAQRVAIDIPSGVNADTGTAELAFQAGLTLSIEALKYGHLLGNGKLFSGILKVIPIGIPDLLWDDVNAAVLLDETTAQLPDRSDFSHKGDYGRIAVFAGSPGFTGAAFLASLAAVKSGAGLVTIFCHPEQMRLYDNKPYEVMVRAIPVQEGGKIDSAALMQTLDRYDVILFGPGCTVSEFTLQTLGFVLNVWNKSAVIDADGLNTLAQHPELYAQLADKPIILTPHWGEFCRLAGTTTDDLQQDCMAQLRQFVEKHKTKVLLKSHTSIYHDSDITYLNISGNDGLATGGSGDVLSGLIAGFLAQKMSPANSAGMAAYYLGLTAEQLADKQKKLSITPTAILDNIFKCEQAEADLPDEK